MMFTTSMKLMAAVVLRRDADAVAERLLRLGVMDAVSVRDLSGEWDVAVSAPEPRPRNERVTELRKRVESFFAMANPPLPLPDFAPAHEAASDAAGAGGSNTVADSAVINLESTEKTLNELTRSMADIRDRQKAIQDELLKLKDMRMQVSAMGDLDALASGALGSKTAGTSSILDLMRGTMPLSGADGLDRVLAGIPSIVLRGESGQGSRIGILLIVMKRDSARVLDAIRREGWENAPDSQLGRDKASVMRELDEKERVLAEERDRRASELKHVLASRYADLSSAWRALRTDELTERIRSSFSSTERTVLVSGWIPDSSRLAVESELRAATNGKLYLEWLSPGSGDAKKLDTPVALSNPKVLKPFQDLVGNYGVPEYGTIDPTPFVAISYLCMFGLMFGDAGHGLVIAIIGILGIARARKKGAKDGLFRLIAYCGGAAIVSGLLFGSVFGHELLPPLWFNYHGAVTGTGHGGPVSSIYDILGITVRFGIVVMGMGMAINWINLIRKKKWFELVFDKAGVFGAWIYGAGAWMAFYFVAHDYKALPSMAVLALALGIPTLGLGLKAPLEFYRENRHEHKLFGGGTLFGFVLSWLVEVLEIYSGYLANTLSFMRVAGLGIAHVSLMTAFAQIAAMTSPGGGTTLWGVLILVLGNALVIALEGLSAGIQSLRLNYYEFFSKFFNGTGKAYRPISLRSRD